jgi:hypothetical protein
MDSPLSRRWIASCCWCGGELGLAAETLRVRLGTRAALAGADADKLALELRQFT